MNVIFVVNSRRFGKSLGIDLSPNEKCCNFDCLYCELGKGALKYENNSNLSVDYILDELKNALKIHNDCDVITITANGEPTLYPNLHELIIGINKLKTKEKSLILSNSSTINDSAIQKALLNLDIVKLSLDSALQKTFSKIDRTNIDLEKIINGMISFSKIYKGELILESLILEGINDNETEMKALNEVFGKINASRLDINTLDRPSDYDVKAVSYEKLEYLASFLTNIKVNIACRKPTNKNIIYDDFLKSLALRPLSTNEIKDENIQKYIDELIKNNKVQVINQNGILFYKLRK